MKKLKIVFIIACVTLMSSYNFYGQSKFSLDLNKPFPMGDLKDFDYKGLGDLGMRFTLFHITKLDVGLGINAGYFKIEDAVHSVALRTKIVGQIKLLMIEPYVGVGYGHIVTWMPDYPEYDSSDGGLNLGVGVKFFPLPKLYVNVGYDTTSFSEEKGGGDFSFLNLGLGLEF